MSDDAFRDSLPTDAMNYDVWCERCQRVHRFYTYTREDHDRVIAEGAQNLSDAIDAMAAKHAYEFMHGDRKP